MIDALKAADIFNKHLDLWVEWSKKDDAIFWIDIYRLQHEAKTNAELEKWFNDHTDLH